jgi:mannitol/fructose-specific phosphotransferase system IIA component (Ntr-type)
MILIIQNTNLCHLCTFLLFFHGCLKDIEAKLSYLTGVSPSIQRHPALLNLEESYQFTPWTLDDITILHDVIKLLENGSILLNVESTNLLKDSHRSIIGQLLYDLMKRNLIDETYIPEIRTSIVEEEEYFPNALNNAFDIIVGSHEAMEHPIIAFARLAHPVNLDARDGSLTKFVFLFIGSLRHSLQLMKMGRIVGYLCTDDDFHHDTWVAENREDFIRALWDFEKKVSIFTKWPSRASSFHADSPDFNSEHHLSAISPPPPKKDLKSYFQWRFARCLVEEVRCKLPWYLSEFKDGCHFKCLTAILLLLFACLAPTITFGALMNKGTHGHIGVSEALLATMIHGVIFSLTSAQPIILLGTTGPFLIFTEMLYQLSTAINQPFLYLYLWTGIWMSLITIAIALFNLCGLIHYCTKFTDEIFCVLISMVYLLDPWTRNFIPLAINHGTPTVKILMSFILLSGTFFIVAILRYIRTSPYLRSLLRSFLADFGYIIAILLMTGFSYIWPSAHVDHLNVPQGIALTMPRPWLIPWNGKNIVYTIQIPNSEKFEYGVRDAALWVIPFGLISGILGSILVFLDTNLTSRLINSSKNKLKKGHGLHLDYLIIGILLLLSSIIGLPWFYAATVRSLTHLMTLSRTEKHIHDGKVTYKVVAVYENRVSGLFIHVLIGLAIFLSIILNQIPTYTLLGIFSFMGYAALESTEMFQRMKLLVADPAFYPLSHYVRKIPVKSIHLFTLIQVLLVCFLYVISECSNFVPTSHVLPWISITFPLFIILLVPIRNKALPYLVNSKYLHILDSEEI